MIKDFILPDIGEGVVECELVEWLVNEGDHIAEDQAVCDVMTDKALVQIPAPVAGVVSKLYYAKGDIAKVHAPLYAVETEEGSSAKSPETPVAQSTIATQQHDFLLPDIGEGIVECELVEWLVGEGEQVSEDQPVCDVMTDKALVQIPAIQSGVIIKHYCKKGDMAKVHEPLFAIEVAKLESAQPSDNTQLNVPKTEPAITSPDDEMICEQGKALASPAVRRLARSLNIDIAQVAGSGKNGRVYKEDINNHVNGNNINSVDDVKNAKLAKPVVASVITNNAIANTTVPIKGIQKVMVKMMTESVSTIPHFTYCEEIDLTELIAVREEIKQQYAKDGLKVTMMPFFMKSMSLALKEFPVINSQLNADCTELTLLAMHNIGMAVDSKLGLLVPNIKGVNEKTILEIAAEITRLTDAARAGRVDPNDLQGGTITISNIGALGGTVATPIINKPEVAIVALGKVQTLPRFNANGEVVARKIMQVSWSGDHRVIDGGTIARFCNLWKKYLETPQQMLMAMH